MYSIPLGASLALIGNTVISASFTLIKYAHMHFGEKYMRCRWWWFGMLIMAPGELFNLVAFGFAPTTLVSIHAALRINLTHSVGEPPGCVRDMHNRAVCTHLAQRKV